MESARVVDSSEVEVECPSGMTGAFRGLIGRDYRSFNRQTARTGEGVTKILNACFTVADPGIYKTNAAGNVDWNDVLVGDRMFGLISIRRAMFPDEPYTFRIACREKFCRQPIHWGVPLAELPIKKLPEESKALLTAGTNEFEVPLVGQRVWFQLLTGRDQIKRHKLIQQAQRRALADSNEKASDLVYALAARIVRVEGLDFGHGDSIDFETKVKWLEEIGTPDHRRLLRAMDKVDCGVETTIELTCEECGSQQEVELPFDETFLFPK